MASYFLAIGGTGAKCAEALVHVVAAGLFPGNVWTGFVDTDRTNGNLRRAKDAIESYKAISSLLGPPHHEVTLSQGDGIWTPVEDVHQKFRDVFSSGVMSDDAKDTFDALFTSEEQESSLEHGFRGRPHMGVATILTGDFSDADRCWADLLGAIRQQKTGENTKIFIAGSIFGGTGAAGLPGFARKLRRLCDKAGVTNLEIGGLLMLPYFVYGGTSTEGLTADPETFLLRASVALDYYSHLLRSERCFDHLYVLGWSPLIPMGDYIRQDTSADGVPVEAVTGGPGQVNPPLLPELFGALAASHFFSMEAEHQSTKSTRVFCIGRSEQKTVRWNDFGNDNLRRALGGSVRFAYAYSRIFAPLLATGIFERHVRNPWFRSLVDGAPMQARLRDEKSQMLIAQAQAYCELLLRWAATISEHVSRDSQPKPELFDLSGLIDKFDHKSGLYVLRNVDENDMTHAAFDRCVADSNQLSLTLVLEALSYPALDKSPGLAPFCQVLRRACET